MILKLFIIIQNINHRWKLGTLATFFEFLILSHRFLLYAMTLFYDLNISVQQWILWIMRLLIELVNFVQWMIFRIMWLLNYSCSWFSLSSLLDLIVTIFTLFRLILFFQFLAVLSILFDFMHTFNKQRRSVDISDTVYLPLVFFLNLGHIMNLKTFILELFTICSLYFIYFALEIHHLSLFAFHCQLSF
jgi:hypothetical protein